MFGPTTDVTRALIGAIDLEGIDPYENWEKATRPSGAAMVPLWQPAYVELLADAGNGQPLPYLPPRGCDLAGQPCRRGGDCGQAFAPRPRHANHLRNRSGKPRCITP